MLKLFHVFLLVIIPLEFMRPCHLIALLVLFLPAVASAQEGLEMVNRPVNVSGLTGLLYTTSPFTLPARDIELTASISEENSDIPDYRISELPAVSVTAGISRTMEMAIRGTYVHETIGEGPKNRGAGDTMLSYKWNFRRQAEDSPWPAAALIMTGISNTQSDNIEDTNSVERVSHWGARLGLAAGREIEWGDHVIGVFADGSIAVQDLNKQDRRDRYGIFNAGVIIPISKYRNLQMMVEYRLVNGINNTKSSGDDYSAVTSGLRLVTQKFNFSIGSQFIDKRTTGLETAKRLLGMVGVKF